MDFLALHNKNYREYNIKNCGNNIDEIRIEAIKDNIIFLLKSLSTLDYVYKNKINISSLITELKFPKNCISNIELLLQKFDDI